MAKYPLYPGMTLNEIKKVSIEDIRKASMRVAKRVENKYKGTDFYVDMELADRLIKFITILKHTGGALGGIPFRLLEFQAEYVIETLCVLQKKNGYRKHKESILFIPRKNGKSELAAAINLWLFFGDKEKQKEGYVIASETQQATIIYDAVVSMLKQTPALRKRVDIWKSTKSIEKETKGFKDIFKVLSATAGTKDGLKASVLFSDEAHAYKDSALYDVMAESMAHRDQPLAILVTTAGYNKQGFFFRKLNYARQVMDGTIKDDSIYLMDFSVDPDNWTDEKEWIKCNPALGFGVKLDYLRDKYHKALHSAVDEVGFKTKHLNLFTDSAVTWIKHEDWMASNQKTFTEDDLMGRECYGGLDLSSTTDLTALVYVFPNREDKSYDVLCRFFVPLDNARERSKVDRVSYLDWIRDGHIAATEGNVVDYDVVESQIRKDSELFDIRELAFDRWNSHGLVTNLEQDNFTMVGFGMGYKSMSSPTKEIEALVLQKRLNHNNNPVLSWNIANVAIITDPADNVKMDKSKAIEKIDGAVALAMAIGRASLYIDDEVDFNSLIG